MGFIGFIIGFFIGQFIIGNVILETLPIDLCLAPVKILFVHTCLIGVHTIVGIIIGIILAKSIPL